MNQHSSSRRAVATAKIVTIYAIFGLAWIYGSDTVLGWLVHDPAVMTKIAVIKGSLFIVCTATLLFFLINRFAKELATVASQHIEVLKDYQAIFNATDEAIFVHDAQTGRILDVNESMIQMFGYSLKEALNMDIGQFSQGSPPYSLKEAADYLNNAMTVGPQVFEWLCRKKSGELFWADVSLKRTTTNDYDRIIAVVRDISERKQSERALNDSRQQLIDIVDFLPDATFVVDNEKRVLYWNKAMEEMTGVSKGEMLGQGDRAYTEPFYGERRMNLLDLLDMDREELRAKYTNIFRKGESLYAEAFAPALYGGKGSHIWAIVAPLYNAEGIRVGAVESIRDITELKRVEDERLEFEQQILHSQKLESLGVLAGGIAHDFNNILMTIMGNADLALMRINRESPALENLHRIEQGAAQAADLAKQMLAYSGKGRFVIENIDLNLLIQEMVHMLEVSISKNAVLRFNLHQHLPSVEADATQMRQVIMNLVINASEAIGDKSGVIAITTGCMDCDSTYLKDFWLIENINEGLYVYLEIADTGCGMDREILNKLFDPFFTTKFTGRGLGMAAVLGIVRGHKGAIKVYSEMGKGTTFKILLPASDRPAELFDEASNHDDWRGSGTVLLVDDEETVRGIGSELLKELGYNVITAVDGKDAIEKFKTISDITFVLLDLTMPHMDGEQCFRELRQLKPDIKVIMSSGYNEQEVTQKFVGKGLAGFIQKPYKLSVLKNAILKN